MKRFDVVVIGSGPAGQKAAIQSAKAGRSVAVIEQLKEVGGACVHHGTIPSKALRERALQHSAFSHRLEELPVAPELAEVHVAELIGEMGEVIHNHDQYMKAQLERNGIEIIHARASFIDRHHLEVQETNGARKRIKSEYIVIATGSTPRMPENIPIDHENIYDSDSILSLAYLPESMVVLGGGVIACEYASVFALLGVKVTMIDRYPRPLGFLDATLTEHFVSSFEAMGGCFLGETEVLDSCFDGVSSVQTRLADGRVVNSEKLLCALGRISRLDGLKAEDVGVKITDRLLVEVDPQGKTSVDNIYAAGDVVGPPSLASASMEQGRRAACDFLAIDPGCQGEWTPSGIYAVPELACVGATEEQVVSQYGAALTGCARFNEIARGHIAGSGDGLLKMVASPDRVVRGVHIVGENATEMIHIAQMGLIQSATVETYIENVFNFPTYAECFRVAALQIEKGEADTVAPVETESQGDLRGGTSA